jgi:SAM-dependent methyltransferase
MNTPAAHDHHPLRARANAWFFRIVDAYMHLKYARLKRRLFTDMPATVVEIGAGSGANLRYLAPGTHVIAVEPNVHTHRFLRRAAARRRLTPDIVPGGAEQLPLADASVEVVLSSLVLCSVSDRERVLREVRRVLRPGGRFLSIEHVAAPPRTAVGLVQRALFRPWRWIFEGCHTHPDTEAQLARAGFSSLSVEPFVWRTAFVPVRPQIAAVAVR